MRTSAILKFNARALRLSIFFLILFLPAISVSAQLVADFSVDREAGCSPLLVQFTNKTTGASANARYLWDLGNGNTSSLVSPGATYRNEQAYTVQLTVIDGADTSRKSGVIRVYRKPVVDFSATNNQGCFPLPVGFTSNVLPGDGVISNYTWDFGDGTVTQGATEQAPVHTYRFAQNFKVSLTVANSMGCATTLEQAALVAVQAGVKAGFTSNQKNICQEGEAVQFTNTSMGTGVLNYAWDFGDGNSSTAASPRHVYRTKGTYTVKLRVFNTQGCTDEMVMPGYIQVANFTSGIRVPQVACANSPVTFKAITGSAPDSLRWQFGTGMPVSTSDSAVVTYTTPGSKSVTLTTYWGACPVVVGVRVQIQAPPVLGGFLQEVAATCQLPYTVQLEDTSGGEQATWEVQGQAMQTGPRARFTFDTYGRYPVKLSVANTLGCATAYTREVTVVPPGVKVQVASTSSRYGNEGCVGMQVGFAVQSAVPLTAYRWDFGDGSPVVTSANPVHAYNRAGRFNVVLRYATATGCTDTAMFREIAVFTKPRIDFSSETNVCSSNPVGFTASGDTAVRRFYWDYGDGSGLDSVSSIQNFNEHKYRQEGVYTVRLIANGTGVCADTLTKTGFITVHPPFQAIQNVISDCLIDRNRIFFQLNTRGVLSGTWDFGDSTTQTTVPAPLNMVPHSFAQPGLYRVKHTSVNGACTAVDSVYVPVPGKQNPVLSGSKSFVCLEDTLTLTISGLNLLNLANYKNNPEQYRLSQLKYGDGRLFNGVVTLLDGNWATGYKIMVNSRDINASGLKAFITSNLNGCTDSTNLFTVRFSGPAARPGQITPVCYNQDVVLRDSSAGNITKWQWQVANEWLPEQTGGGNTTVRLPAPGVYPVTLKVTDADGCYHFASVNGGLTALGAKAGFQLPDTVVAINTPAQFTNTSQVASGAAVAYTWTYDAGRRSAAVTHLVHSYPNIGWDTLRLVARTVQGGCADSAFGILHHDNINAKFTYTATYINGNACPPLLVKLTNLSRNTRRTLWTFGDGSSAENQNNPERTYRVGGTYKVTLYTFGPNNLVDSASEYITVKGPSARIEADQYSGCLNQNVTLKASVAYARDYYWDYGDGTLLRSQDTVARHHYNRAGVYQPTLVLSDSTGCSVAAELPQPVVIDSLSLAISGMPPLMCDVATVHFQPKVVSVAVDKLGQHLQYNWHFPNTNSSLAAPEHQFRGEGRYPVSVTATSPYGCVQTATDTVWIRRTVKGIINGRPEVCVGNDLQFTATVPDAAAAWRWVLHDGRTGTSLQSPVLSLRDSGFYPEQLVVTHDGCVDTARQNLWVHPRPVIRFANPIEHVCRGLATTLQASGGHTYRWTSSEPILLGAGLDKPVVYPSVTASFTVLATSFFGCQSTDSMIVRVSQPFKLQPLADTFVCRGSSRELRAAGAATYQWSGPAGTLDRVSGPVVMATPTGLSKYRVIGSDSMQCFRDTAYATVRIQELPLVKLGPDQLLLTGTELKLAARTSEDVVQYRWQPAAEVACATCPHTTAEPRKPASFSLTVTDKFGCIASDTLSVNLKCTDSRVFIPNAFTPDHNGLNETFSVRGKGAWVKKLMIYDRWGKLVYDAANLQLNDSRSGWNGTCNSKPCPSGTYAYMVELVCDTGEPFVKKGTVTVIR